MDLRKAKRKESDLLNHIAFESEGIWGEDANYMERFSKEYKVTEKMIETDYVRIMESGEDIIGFFVVLKEDPVPELEMFYIAKPFIGKGFGTILWTLMVEFCRQAGLQKIALVGSQDVVDFYRKMGAQEVEKIESLLKTGRIVTKFEYRVQ